MTKPNNHTRWTRGKLPPLPFPNESCFQEVLSSAVLPSGPQVWRVCQSLCRLYQSLVPQLDASFKHDGQRLRAGTHFLSVTRLLGFRVGSAQFKGPSLRATSLAPHYSAHTSAERSSFDEENEKVYRGTDDVQKGEYSHVNEEEIVLGLEDVKLREHLLQNGQQRQRQRQQKEEQRIGDDRHALVPLQVEKLLVRLRLPGRGRLVFESVGESGVLGAHHGGGVLAELARRGRGRPAVLGGGHEGIFGHVRLAHASGVLVQRGHEGDVGRQHGEQRAVLEEAAAGDGQVVQQAVVAQVDVGVGQVGHGLVGAREGARLDLALEQLVGVKGQDEQGSQQDEQLGAPEEEEVVRAEGRHDDEVAVQTHEGRGHDDELQTARGERSVLAVKLQTHPRFKRTLFIRTEHNVRILQVIPYIELQNDT